MKRLSFVLSSMIALIILIFAASSCKNFDEAGTNNGIYGTIGTYEKTGTQPYFVLDDSLTLITNNDLNIPDSLIGSRFFLEFQTVEPGLQNPNYDYTVNLLNLQQVSTKNVVVVTTLQQLDSMGHAGILPSWVWCSSHYMNIVYYVKGTGTVSHSVNLIENLYDPIASGDTVIFELKHNANGDAQYQELRGVSSFNLTPFMDQAQDSILRMMVYFYSYTQGSSSIYLEYNLNQEAISDYTIDHISSKSPAHLAVPPMKDI